MADRVVELAKKMRQYGLWGSRAGAVSKDGRFALKQPPGVGQKDWAAEVLYLDNVPIGYWIGGDGEMVYGAAANSKVSITEESLFNRMESLLLDWLEEPKPAYEPDNEFDTFITRYINPLLLVGLQKIEKTQWEIEIFLVNVGPKSIVVTIKATGAHFCTIENVGGKGEAVTEGEISWTPQILIGIIAQLKQDLREWWWNKLFIAPVTEDPSVVPKEPLMAFCDPEGVWTINYEWVAWSVVKQVHGNTPTAAITHAIMRLEKLYDADEFEKVICEKMDNPLQFRLYQITKTLVKPGKEEGEEQ